MSAEIPSNIRVFVTFKDSTVFAGDDIEATITFKNVEFKRTRPQRPVLSLSASNGSAAPSAIHSATTSQAHSRPALSRNASIASNLRKPSQINAQRHRPAMSLNIVDSATSRSRGPISSGGINIAEPSPRPSKHGRSVSIVSLGSDASRGERLRGSQPSQTPKRPSFKHVRSASVQVSSPSQRVGRSPSLTGRSTLPSPLSNVASPRYRSAESYFLQRSSPVQAGRVPSLDQQTDIVPPGGHVQQGFRFPPSSNRPLPHRNATVATMGSAASINPKEPNHLETAPVNRVLSLSSETGTPRSSGDFYSLSNRSDETLASDYQTQPLNRLLQKPTINQLPSNLNPGPARKIPETLMMGYVQISGSFVLDGSLVNAAPFEEVKRKAVVGGQGGGGVVGIEQKKANNGLFGSFGWSNIGESLGGLLRAGEQSSFKEMKSIATSKSIPLLSTPKSVLFVDLELNPGESRTYSYTFPLPRGLPPSHRGRAIKLSYQLIVGTQRPSTGKSQYIRQVEIPFRVFSSVNAQGDILGYDLLNPYIILQDQARTASLDQETTAQEQPPPNNPSTNSQASEADFTHYIERLLGPTRDPDTNALLSPTADPEDLALSPAVTLSRHPSISSPTGEHLPSARNLIDNAMRLAVLPATGLPTSFTIARSSNTIAVLTISRPALRLGDTLHVALDFSTAAIPCYAIDLSLETIEVVDPSLAIRSAASVERATRRVWDKRTEPGFALGWCGRWGGRLKVPWNASPGFETTGVSCKWMLRVEIVVGSEGALPQAAQSQVPEDEQDLEDDTLPPGKEGEGDSSGDETLSALSEDTSHLSLEHGETRPLDSLALGANLVAPRRRSSSSARRQSAQLARGSQQPQRVDRAALLLEDVGQDERGRHLAPRQRLLCESFDVCVPLRVFGASGGGAFPIGAAGASLHTSGSGRTLESERSGNGGLPV